MGISFIVDDLIDSGVYDGINTGWNPINKHSYTMPFEDKFAYRYSIEDYKKSDDNSVELVMSTEEVKSELLSINKKISCYRIIEKRLLYLKNKEVCTSDVIRDILQMMLEFYEESCIQLSILNDDIIKNYKINFDDINFKYDIEENIDIEILNSICEIVRNTIKRGLPLSTERFKSIVSDLKHLMEILQGKPKVGKRDVEQYFSDLFGLKKGMITCPNCKRELLIDIPYCFICYEGRYSE